MHPGSFQRDPAFGVQANNSVRAILRVRRQGQYQKVPDEQKAQEQVDRVHQVRQQRNAQVQLTHHMKQLRLRRWDQMRQPRQEPSLIGSRWESHVCAFWCVDKPRCAALHRAKV